MENSLTKLQERLKEMFQFNNNDLNFGIFKIYKLKQATIENFIDNELEEIVKKELENISNLSQKEEELELRLFLKSINQEILLNDKILNFETIKQLVNTLGGTNKDKLLKILNSSSSGSIEEDLAIKIYNYILNFFDLYYSNGDFGYNNRSIESYKVEYDEDYDGSDIMFHWKHKGSYYIKSGNGFNGVKFELNGKNIEYILESNEESEDNIAQNNNKDESTKNYEFKELRKIDENNYKVIFFLSKKSTSKEEVYKSIFKEVFNKDLDDKFTIKKDGKPLFNSLGKDFDKVEGGNKKGFSQIKLSKDELIKRINDNFEKSERIEKDFDELDSSIEKENIVFSLYKLDTRLNDFYIGNDSDFFIHKNLGEFLTKEKDKFIKNNILGDLENILSQNIDNTSIIIAKTFNEITKKLIEFLSSIEEFQKGIFESKKKVLVSDYCITLDNIKEEFYDEISKNEEQKNEWLKLGFIGSIEVITIDYLKQNQTLVVDTKFFDKTFKQKLLSSIDNLEENTNGLLINSENFQALNLMLEKYRGKVKCIYIDSPYNTGGDGFMYKDSFKHSSWLSMMNDRLEKAKELLNDDGVIFLSIDDNEQANLKKIMDKIFGNENFIGTFIWTRKKKGSFLDKKIRKMTEYVISYQKKSNDVKFYGEKAYSNKYQPIVKRTNSLKELVFKKGIVKTTLPNGIYESGFRGNNDTGLDFLNNFEVKDGNIINEIKCKGKFVWTQSFLDNEIESGSIIELSSKFGFNVLRFNQSEKTKTPSSLINSENGVGTNEDATNELSNIFGGEIGSIFSYNKPTSLIKYLVNFNTNKNDIILDFFSGSGTTQQATIELNKEEIDNLKKEIIEASENGDDELVKELEETLNMVGKRKYIGVEMGDYFDSVTKPRIEKVIYSSNWKDGKPLDNNGVSQIFKYQVLEQYEDILDKLENGNETIPNGLDLKYLYKPNELKLKSSLDLRNPFNNKYIYGRQKNETFVDIVETYNYIKGYFIDKIDFENYSYTKYNINYALVKVGTKLVIWRDLIEGDLELLEIDSNNILKLLKNYEDIEEIEVNVEFYNLGLDKHNYINLDNRKIEVNLITLEDFNI